jgi:protein-S-isoprenylcysteine O-methyltransferase Ste14
MRAFLTIVFCVAFSAIVWGLIVGRWRGSARRDRATHAAKEGVQPLMRIPVPWVFMLAYVAALAPQLVKPVHIPPSLALSVRIGGAFVIAIGMLLAFSARGIFRGESTTTVPFETPSALVTSGPYRFTRNPMYVGLALVYLGVASTRLEVWPTLALPFVLLYLNFVVIPVEESRLGATFGEPYAKYQQTVRRWL